MREWKINIKCISGTRPKPAKRIGTVTDDDLVKEFSIGMDKDLFEGSRGWPWLTKR